MNACHNCKDYIRYIDPENWALKKDAPKRDHNNCVRWLCNNGGCPHEKEIVEPLVFAEMSKEGTLGENFQKFAKKWKI